MAFRHAGGIPFPRPHLQAALNGDRVHPQAPREPATIARAAEAAVAAGAQSVHVHVFDAAGAATLEADPCAAVLRALRARIAGVPVSLTTSARILNDPDRRLAAVAGWTEMPDLVTACQGEPGIVPLCTHFLARGVGIEACLLSPQDARLFVASGLAGRCTRIVIEALDPDVDRALAAAAEMEEILSQAGVALPQVHHGFDASCWPVNARARERGHGLRVGLEDTTTMPDGSPAPDNAALVAVGAAWLRRTASADNG